MVGVLEVKCTSHGLSGSIDPANDSIHAAEMFEEKLNIALSPLRCQRKYPFDTNVIRRRWSYSIAN